MAWRHYTCSVLTRVATPLPIISTRTYQNAIGMCILQIGERVKHLSPDFTAAHPQIDWRGAARARDTYAHHYGRIDFEIAWESSTAVIDEPRAFCIEQLA